MTTMKTMRRPSRERQRGAALLTAMIIVALVATLAAAMVWQQWRAVQVEGAERARAQSTWILTGARDFAGLILREDFKGSIAGTTTLNDPWATPLKEGRLSTFLALDKSPSDDDPDAFLSGYLNDAQARFNLINLISATGKVDASVQPALDALQRLCENLGLDGSAAPRIAAGLNSARGANGATGTSTNAPLEPKTVDQLTWLGIDQESIKRLKPFVVLISPQQTGVSVPTPVNVNTASKEVLAAVVNIDQGTAERIVQLRQRAPFKDVPSFTNQFPSPTGTSPSVSVRSDYFEVSGSLRLGDRVLTERSLVQRTQNRTLIPLQRERIAALEQVGG